MDGLRLSACIGTSLALCLWIAPPALAEVALPSVFSKHMVLQGGKPVSVWGKADPGERVSVRIAGQTHRTRADSRGRWSVVLKPLTPESKPLTMTVSGASNRLVVEDVLVGEVWLASGQSNMEKPFRLRSGQKDVFDAEAELAKADYPSIRIFKINRARGASPKEDVEGEWMICDGKALDQSQFSAAAYYFGRDVHLRTGRAVGLIGASWGGTRIEPWIAPEGFDQVDSLKRFRGAPAGAKVDGADVSTIYNGMIAPIVPYGLRGVIWYQGESNVIEFGGIDDYADKVQALVAGWRSAFRQNIAFYSVQIAPHLYHVLRPHTVASPEALPQLREAQVDALRIPDSGLVVTTDLTDDLFDIHPRNKRTVGQRLALLALKQTYGVETATVSGPRFRSMAVDGSRIVVRFDDVGDGLVAKDNKPLNWFQIAGADGVWRPAVAKVEQDTIVLTSPQEPNPVAARFAWDEAAQPNLFNANGFPAWPFRSPRP